MKKLLLDIQTNGVILFTLMTITYLPLESVLVQCVLIAEYMNMYIFWMGDNFSWGVVGVRHCIICYLSGFPPVHLMGRY